MVVAVEDLVARGRVDWSRRVRLVMEIVVTYRRARRLMKSHDIRRVVAALRDAPSPGELEPEVARAVAIRLRRPVMRTLSVLPFDSRCLMRSLVLVAMMARRGARCDLSIGARVEEGFGAHAWVEYRGAPVLDPLGYAPLTTI